MDGKLSPDSFSDVLSSVESDLDQTKKNFESLFGQFFSDETMVVSNPDYVVSSFESLKSEFDRVMTLSNDDILSCKAVQDAVMETTVLRKRLNRAQSMIEEIEFFNEMYKTTMENSASMIHNKVVDQFDALLSARQRLEEVRQNGLNGSSVNAQVLRVLIRQVLLESNSLHSFIQTRFTSMIQVESRMIVVTSSASMPNGTKIELSDILLCCWKMGRLSDVLSNYCSRIYRYVIHPLIVDDRSSYCVEESSATVNGDVLQYLKVVETDHDAQSIVLLVESIMSVLKYCVNWFAEKRDDSVFVAESLGILETFLYVPLEKDIVTFIKDRIPSNANEMSVHVKSLSNLNQIESLALSCGLKSSHSTHKGISYSLQSIERHWIQNYKNEILMQARTLITRRFLDGVVMDVNDSGLQNSLPHLHVMKPVIDMKDEVSSSSSSSCEEEFKEVLETFSFPKCKISNGAIELCELLVGIIHQASVSKEKSGEDIAHQTLQLLHDIVQLFIILRPETMKMMDSLLSNTIHFNDISFLLYYCVLIPYLPESSLLNNPVLSVHLNLVDLIPQMREMQQQAYSAVVNYLDKHNSRLFSNLMSKALSTEEWTLSMDDVMFHLREACPRAMHQDLIHRLEQSLEQQLQKKKAPVPEFIVTCITSSMQKMSQEMD